MKCFICNEIATTAINITNADRSISEHESCANCSSAFKLGYLTARRDEQ